MNDPRRLLDEGDDFERKMLASAVREKGGDNGYQRTLAAMGIGGAAATAAGAAKATAAGLGAQALGTVGQVAPGIAALGLAKWIGLGVIVGVVTVAGIRLGAPTREVHSPVISSPAPSAPTVQPTETAVQVPTSSAAILAHRDEPSSVAAPALSKTEPAVAAPSASMQEQPIAASGLAQELAALDAARALLRAGNGAGALAKLDAFDRQFPAAGLSHESTLLRVQALMATGNHSAARQLAQSFVTRHPQSPHVPQLRGWFPDLTIP